MMGETVTEDEYKAAMKIVRAYERQIEEKRRRGNTTYIGDPHSHIEVRFMKEV